MYQTFCVHRIQAWLILGTSRLSATNVTYTKCILQYPGKFPRKIKTSVVDDDNVYVNGDKSNNRYLWLVLA